MRNCKISITAFVSTLIANGVLKVQTTSIYDGCSDEKQCFGYPKDCVNQQSCEMIVSLKLSKENTDVEITHTNLERSNYVAMAFSDDKNMGKDLVFACSPSWSSPPTHLDDACGVFWNKEGEKKNEKLNDKEELVEILSKSDEGSLFTVKFSLPNQVTIDKNKFDLEKGHYILLATGAVNETNLKQHTAKMASTSMFGKKANSEVTEGNSTLTTIQEGETHKNTNKDETSTYLENKQTTMPEISVTDENKPASKASSDGEKATGSATNHFFSKLAIAMTFISIHVNA